MIAFNHFDNLRAAVRDSPSINNNNRVRYAF